MKVGAIIRSYHLTKYLPAVIKQYKWCDRVLVLNYKFPNVVECDDNTKEIATSLGVEYEWGEGLKQHEIFNRGITALRDCATVFISDADEFILKDDQYKLVRLALDHDFVLSRVIDYTDYDTSLPMRDHKPVVCVNPKSMSFYDVRNASGNSYTANDIYMHHFGYAWKDKELDWKHANKWYTEFFEMKNQPSIHANCPQEIRSLIDG